jgi:hypothetical protein
MQCIIRTLGRTRFTESTLVDWLSSAPPCHDDEVEEVGLDADADHEFDVQDVAAQDEIESNT